MTSGKRGLCSDAAELFSANTFHMVAGMMTGPVNRPATASLRRKQLIA
jgi:hypothetical protein